MWFLLFSADGKQLFGVDEGGFACVWDLGGGVTKTKELGRATRSGWYVSPDRNTIVSSVYNGINWIDAQVVQPWELKSQQFRPGDYMLDANLSKDGKHLLVGMEDKVFLLKDDFTKEKRNEVHHAHTKPIYRMAMSPKDQLIASGSHDQTAVVWDLKAKKKRITHKDFDGPVGVQFSPDGKTLFAWGTKGSKVRRFDVASGEELKALAGHTKGVQHVFFRDGGKRLVVSEHDGKVTLYDVASLP
jgi:WD40 repeat protein